MLFMLKGKIINTLKLYISISVLYLLCSSNIQAQQTIILASDPWPPFVLGKEGSPATGGVGVTLINAIFDRIDNTHVHIPLMPWKRVLNNVRQGRVDGTQFLYKTPERSEYMVFSDPLFLSQDLAWYSKIHHPNGLSWQTIDDLKPYTIGGVSGYSYSPDIDKAKEKNALKYVEADNTEQLFTMLVGGRIDIALANKVVGTSQVKLHAPERPIIAMDKAIAQEHFYIGISKKRQGQLLVSDINKALKTLKAEGMIEQIIYGE